MPHHLPGGEDLFYRGELAHDLAAACAAGGHLTLEDLRRYRVIRRGPLSWRYRGHRLASNPPPSTGGVLIAFAMKLLEDSIDGGTQWAVFEPNGERLWANVRQTISDFLFNEWRNGALLGASPEQAYFVRCDRSTMTQNDIDNGRLVCMVGVAPVKPAEFVIFRIGQWTADHKA